MANPNIPLKLKDGAKIRRGKKPKSVIIVDKTCSEGTSVNNKVQEIPQDKSSVQIWYESRMSKNGKKRGEIHKKTYYQIIRNFKNAYYKS